MKLIVGLGNPGKEYKNTRHNAGFRFIDTYAKVNNVKINKKKLNGLYGVFTIQNEEIILLKPQKFMNLSGEVIMKYIDYFKIDKDDLFIICDDMDTAVGKFKLKHKGSSGGHNGLKNIEKYLKTIEYKRLKIGIGKNKEINKTDYVIGQISKEELNQINQINNLANDLIKDYLTMSFDNLMNKYNKKG